MDKFIEEKIKKFEEKFLPKKITANNSEEQNKADLMLEIHKKSYSDFLRQVLSEACSQGLKKAVEGVKTDEDELKIGDYYFNLADGQLRLWERVLPDGDWDERKATLEDIVRAIKSLTKKNILGEIKE